MDKQVRALIDRHREKGAKLYLRTREELEAIGIPCPYEHARTETVFAVRDA
ncbi:hypothetical protein FHR71_005590 [Methylobacterium sp. RAS18]|nr:hypothetical protein [Methylobacterium sp. RAS18]